MGLGAGCHAVAELEVGDDASTTARREFYEETGSQVTGKFVPLKPLKQPSGKLVHAWAVNCHP
jgi:predicted NUDIX family NTP pyrophosphohydrolase